MSGGGAVGAWDDASEVKRIAWEAWQRWWAHAASALTICSHCRADGTADAVADAVADAAASAGYGTH